MQCKCCSWAHTQLSGIHDEGGTRGGHPLDRVLTSAQVEERDVVAALREQFADLNIHTSKLIEGGTSRFFLVFFLVFFLCLPFVSFLCFLLLFSSPLFTL